MSKLTPKQQLFAVEYLKDLNATQAYLRAGYRVDDNTAKANGARLLANANVAAAISEAMATRAAKVGIDANDVLEGIVAVRDDAMTKTKEGSMASRQDALKALELLGKHLGMFTTKMEHTGADSGPVIVKWQD